jgi:hypothetical protein
MFDWAYDIRPYTQSSIQHHQPDQQAVKNLEKIEKFGE